MTDITELAQREKFEAWFVNDVVGAEVTFPGMEDGEYVEGEIYDEQLYFMLQAMWMAWKAAGAELVEALEKAQQRNTELENYADAEAVGADKAAEDSVYWMKRCKALESRTIIVKLPKERSATEFMFPVPVYSVQELTASLTAQGIKWEAE
ncbi:hypothetical protein LO750_04710 [Klebsiella aerogenes]|uniref:hypothetical protein n=1 Tax=Klebsiella aerogenes TaxID=548 RepID=UPI001E5893CD|nr:hypothetical protein [Klebsiella aerogenes]MCD0203299.1 hypothetical protein [Klebsiella aerogenes]